MKRPFTIRISKLGATGRHSGATLDLPATWTEMQDALDRARVTDDPGSYKIEPENIWYSFLHNHITATTELYALNHLAQRLRQLDRLKTNAFEGLVKMEVRNNRGEPVEVERLLQLTHNLDNCVVDYGIRDNITLGNFLYENDMLTDEEYEMATFKKNSGHYAGEYLAKLGKQHAERENGVFAKDGYVENLGGITEVDIPKDAGRPERPPASVILQLSKGRFNDPAYGNGITVRVACPAGEDAVQSAMGTVGAVSLEECAWSCTDCLIPAAREWVDGCEDFETVNTFAHALQEFEPQDKLPKYKALLEATRCDELGMAVHLAGELDGYILHSGMVSPADYAKEKLEALRATREGELMYDHIDLETYGVVLLRQDNAANTSYGILLREDSGPIQTPEREQAPEAPTMAGLS